MDDNEAVDLATVPTFTRGERKMRSESYRRGYRDGYVTALDEFYNRAVASSRKEMGYWRDELISWALGKGLWEWLRGLIGVDDVPPTPPRRLSPTHYVPEGEPAPEIELSVERERARMNPTLRFAILRRCNFTCVYCGAKAPDACLVVDHRLPVSRGGTSDWENLVAACVECNAGKGHREL